MTEKSENATLNEMSEPARKSNVVIDCAWILAAGVGLMVVWEFLK